MSTLHKPGEGNSDSVPVSKETVDYFIQQAIKAENISNSIYVYLTKIFSHEPDVSEFWQHLGYDEAKHAYTLKKIQDSLTAEQLAAPADPTDLSMMENTISLLDTISLGSIRTLDDAYEIAHEIEFSELNCVFECVVSDFMTDEDKKKIIYSELEVHQKKVMDFTKNYGDRNWQRQIIARTISFASSEK